MSGAPLELLLDDELEELLDELELLLDDELEEELLLLDELELLLDEELEELLDELELLLDDDELLELDEVPAIHT